MERPKKTSGRKQRLSSVANSIRMIKVFSDSEYEMGISALAARLGLAKSTAHRLATTLVQYDILEQNKETGRYRLGLALFELGTLVRRKMDLANEARPQLLALMEATGETVQLALLDHQSILYINNMESPKAVRSSARVGSRAPLHCTSLGKALLAFQSPEVVQQVIDAGLRRYTDTTITTADALRAALGIVRSKGYAVDDEEYEVGMRAIAAPVRNHSGDVIAAVGITAPIQRMTKRNLQIVAPTVVAAAEAISRRLGYRVSQNQSGRQVID